MNTAEILDYVQQHSSGKVKLAVTDIDGVLRGKYISREKFLNTLEGTLGFCDVVFGWDVNDTAYDNVSFTGWHSGYPDAPVRIDLSTFRRIPWENDLPFFLGEFVDSDGRPSTVCPRQLLKKIYLQAQEMGFNPFFSQEFEWFNFKGPPQALYETGFRQLTPITPGMFGYSILRTSHQNPYMSDIFEMLTKFGVPIEGLHTETGPGVYEAAIVFENILEAADRAVLFKTGVKEIAARHGIVASFMAKWNENLPGCSGHVHQSLWDLANKANLFHEKNDPIALSTLMRQYLAGQLYCLPHLLPMFAPTVNSYKRLVEGAWAPTTLTWGMDNRTVALRVLASGKKSTRLETRVVGSDTNPYLAMAACLASGLYGIRNQLTLEQPATTGSGYLDRHSEPLPRTLEQATVNMKTSAIARELFGDIFVNHFTQTRDWEWRQYSKAVTDWELKRYFEII